jgi:hypothetical protein
VASCHRSSLRVSVSCDSAHLSSVSHGLGYLTGFKYSLAFIIIMHMRTTGGVWPIVMSLCAGTVPAVSIRTWLDYVKPDCVRDTILSTVLEYHSLSALHLFIVLSSGDLSPPYRLVSESCFVRTCPGERIPGTMVSEDVSRIRDCLPLFESSLEPSVVRCQSITWSVLEERGSPIASGHDSKYGSVQINARESMVSHLEPILAPTLLISPPASTNEKR